MLAINFLSEFEYILGTSPKSSQISMLNGPSSEWGVPYPERSFETSMVFFWIIFHQLWNCPYFCCEGLLPICSYQEWISEIHHIQISAPRYSKDCRSPSCRCARVIWILMEWYDNSWLKKYVHPLYFQHSTVGTYTSFLTSTIFLTSLFFPNSFVSTLIVP